MSQQSVPDWMDVLKFVEAAYAPVIALLAWWGNRMSNKIDVLEKTAVSHDQLKDMFGQMREDHNAMDERNRNSLKRIEDKLDDAQREGVIATRVKRAEDDIEDLRTWKHSVDKFIPRRVDP